MISIDWLREWFEINEPDLAFAGIAYSIFVPRTESENPAQVIDIERGQKAARVSLWESGEFDFESIDSVTGETLLFEHHVIESSESLGDVLTNRVFML
jgi:hypothetical protein